MSWLSDLLSKSKVGRAVNAVGGPLTNIAGSALHSLPVVGSVMDVGRAIGDNLGGAPNMNNVGEKMGQAPGLDQILAAAQAVASGGKPTLPTLGTLSTGGGGQIDPWMKALAVAQGANSAYLGQKSGNYADMAAKNADAAWNQKAPLRAQGVAGMDAGVAPVRLPGLAAISRASNPFARVGP